MNSHKKNKSSTIGRSSMGAALRALKEEKKGQQSEQVAQTESWVLKSGMQVDVERKHLKYEELLDVEIDEEINGRLQVGVTKQSVLMILSTIKDQQFYCQFAFLPMLKYFLPLLLGQDFYHTFYN